MEYIEKLFSGFGGIGGLGVLLAGLGFAFAQVTSGGSKAKDDLILTLKESLAFEKLKSERLSGEKTTLMQSHQTQLNELNGKLGKLQGLYEAAERRNVEMMKILQGRSPDQVQNQKDLHEFTEKVTHYISNTSDTLKGVQAFMLRLDEKAKTNELRNEKIDSDTENENGKVMRKEEGVK